MMHQAKWFIDAAAAAGVQHFVHLTADPPRSTFVQHIAWHELIDNYIEMKLPSKGTFLQPGFFTENLVSYNGRSRVNGGELSVMGVPGSVLPFISCEDIGEVAASCLLDPDRHAGKSYRLFAEARSIEDAVSTISSTIGLTPLTVKYVTPQDIYNEALALDAQDGGRLAYFASLRHNLQDATELTARARKAPGGKVFVPPVYPEVIREIIGRPPLTVVQWAVRNRRYFKL
ncbi:NAD(P)-binding protein [Gonapodya prolifera JEL478]|uniref:NAD(P)-binding protein n=1 Tax=Gonapodya prolifera (strain JEL478) TaxID=1344416 RepID=A0A139AQW2_GONPJ|nr:NAD(P)-binding protein [Gonapodya prolifera JEL478]|eukprot:KXS18885.1 NAD(P)-binding protein [Gonapodya prolifera JEL478]